MLLHITIFVLFWIRATAQNSCDQSLTQTSGNITSPNWPDAFPTDAKCTWKINQLKGSWIKFVIEKIDIRSSGTGCDQGSLSIKGIGGFCSKNPPSVPLATNHEATIYFDIYGATGTGFFLRYDTTSCSMSINNDNGEIFSPNYPNPYPHGVECTWTIKTSYNKRVKIEFLAFDVVGEKNCEGDSVKLIDVKDGQQYVSGVYCGKMAPSAAYSKSNIFMVTFTTNGYAAKSGFKLRYSTERSADLPVIPLIPDRCNLTLDAASGIIKTPNYPYGHLPNRLCIWNIDRPKGDWIDFEFIDLDLNKEDLLTLADNTQIIYTYTKTQNPCKPLATKNKAVIKFNATAATPRRGFMIRYTATSCNREIVGGSGEIYSPNYPIMYPKKIECTWKIKAMPGKKVYVEFLEMETADSTDCSIDSVEVIDVVGGQQRPAGKFCGSSKPALTVSTTSELWIKFRSNTEYPKRGFAFKYNTEWFRTIVISPSRPLKPVFRRFD